eukprot:scaffold1918_cov154-Amphora_coffeaeformis.AAC.6
MGGGTTWRAAASSGDTGACSVTGAAHLCRKLPDLPRERRGFFGSNMYDNKSIRGRLGSEASAGGHKRTGTDETG